GGQSAASHPGRSLFQADIVLTPELRKYLRQQDNRNPTGKVADVVQTRKWPNAVVPYVFKSGFAYGDVTRRAMADIEKHSCIRFKKRTNEAGYIQFVTSRGCWSSIGYYGVQQEISIGHGCGYKGVVIHEIFHGLGFFHEQARLDRDDYIRINWKNIMEGMEGNFEKHGKNEAWGMNEKYDKKSVMHYGNYAFAVNWNQMTIISKSDSKEKLGQREGMSEIDIRQLNKLYCSNGVRSTTTTPTSTTTTSTTTTTTPTTTTTTPTTTTTTPTTTTTTPTTTTTTPTTTTTTRKTTVTTTTQPKPKCADTMKCCPVLATNGLCKSSPYVRKSCPKSCDPECSPSAVKTTTTTTRKTTTTTLPPATTTTKRPVGSKCRDTYSNCSVWVKHNKHCPYAEGCCREGNYVTYMKKHCAKACGYTC
uniref:Metalloendopeptidase n=2 Tax=Clytia hemisphaerica TaxID=252671 RepID=A0A7M5XCG6_9CNID